MPILVHFEDEGTAGKLLVVFTVCTVCNNRKRVSFQYVCYYALAAFVSLTVAK